MKFDYIIGNPPYQDEVLGDNKTFAPPIYHLFMDSVRDVASRVELITPARFLFNAGSTPKEWNNRMLADPHFKVVSFFENAKDVFANVGIAGGVAISYFDSVKLFDPIRLFIPNQVLSSIYHKVTGADDFVGLNTIAVTAYAYRFTEKMHTENPQLRSKLSKGHDYDLKSSVLKRIPEVFYDTVPDDGDYALMIGRLDNERVRKYIRRDYINDVVNFDTYKVLIPKAAGSGDYGSVLSPMEVGVPHEGHIETFMSIGSFQEEIEAINCIKYLKGKFARALLGILKVTQDNPPDKWSCIPIQDFSSSSDIDWSASNKNIDRQLYLKYGLTDDEVAFIETHVKEMS